MKKRTAVDAQIGRIWGQVEARGKGMGRIDITSDVVCNNESIIGAAKSVPDVLEDAKSSRQASIFWYPKWREWPRRERRQLRNINGSHAVPKKVYSGRFHADGSA